MTKMTNKVALTTAIEVLAQDAQYNEVVEKLQKMLEQTVKKNSGTRKMTATQTENVAFKEAILAFMEEDKGYTVTEIMKGCTAVTDLSNQRVTAMLRQLKEAELVTRSEVKGKAFFTKA